MLLCRYVASVNQVLDCKQVKLTQTLMQCHPVKA